MSPRRSTRGNRRPVFPPATAIAAAIVAACERTGEDPLQAMAEPKGSRALLCAADAIAFAYPALHWPEIGRLTSITWSPNVRGLVVGAHKRDWWRDEGSFASKAALVALQGAQPSLPPETPAATEAAESEPAAAHSSPTAPDLPRGGAQPQPRTACAPKPPRPGGPITAGLRPSISMLDEPAEDPLVANLMSQRLAPPGPCGRTEGPLPEAAAVTLPSSRCGSRTVGKAVPMAFKPDFDLREGANVRALRGANVPWAHVHRQVGSKGTVDDLRRRYDPTHPLYGKARADG